MQVAESFGLLIGCATMNPKAAQTVAAIVVLTASITGGYLTRGVTLKPINHIPDKCVKTGFCLAVGPCLRHGCIVM